MQDTEAFSTFSPGLVLTVLWPSSLSFFHGITFKMCMTQLDMVLHAFNPNSEEVEVANLCEF